MFELVGKLSARRAESFGLTGDSAVDNDVGVGGQLNEAPTVVGRRRIEDGAALVRVVQRERQAHAGHGRSDFTAAAAARRLHLDHICTQICQKPSDQLGVAHRQVEYSERGQGRPANWRSHTASLLRPSNSKGAIRYDSWPAR